MGMGRMRCRGGLFLVGWSFLRGVILFGGFSVGIGMLGYSCSRGDNYLGEWNLSIGGE